MLEISAKIKKTFISKKLQLFIILTNSKINYYDCKMDNQLLNLHKYTEIYYKLVN